MNLLQTNYKGSRWQTHDNEKNGTDKEKRVAYRGFHI